MAERRRIGIFGGTFDPVHVGHLVAAINARHRAELDVVVLVPANIPWQKAGVRTIAPAELRFEMVAAAVQGHPGLEASRIEIDRGGTTYTVDTLREIKKNEPSADLFLVMGNDTATGLESWHETEKVAELADLVIVNRPGSPVPVLDAKWRSVAVEIPALEVSSSDLRRRIEDGRPLDFLVPDPAIRVLRAFESDSSR